MSELIFAVLNDKHLSASEARFLAKLVELADESFRVKVSLKVIEEETGISRQHLTRLQKKLVDKGYLTTTFNHGTTTDFQINLITPL